jgi:uncharacterized SAM-binding protein YcdF (DUF218 family)
MELREKFIVLVDNDLIQRSDAIILLEGDGLNRYSKAVELYKQGFADRIVFSGDITNYTYGSIPLSEIYPLILATGVPPEAIIHEKKSLNTREQAIEIIKLAKNSGWTKLILVASHYHQYRAYLTFLKEEINTKGNIVIYNAPAKDLKWFEESGWGQRFELLDQEFERIEKYSDYNHLATYGEAIEYQKWKEQRA